MSRRVRLPGADELFGPVPSTREGDDAAAAADVDAPDAGAPVPAESAASRGRGSGRVRHDEKITVYVTADELLELEHARLALRRELGRAIDRGRIVREALALVIADLDARGTDSDLARRLRDDP